MPVPFNFRCRSKGEFTELLRAWHRDTDEPTIGDTGTYGRQQWLWVDVGGLELHLNADTKRVGVERYLERVARSGPEQPWYVVPNRNGRINRVAPGVPEPIAGFYLYSREPLVAPVTV